MQSFEEHNHMTVRGTSGPGNLKESIIAELRPFFEQKGFLHLPKWEQFRKPTATGFQAVIISLADYDDLSLLEIHLGVRQDAVENLAYPFTNGLMGFRESSMTLITPLAKLHGHAYQRFELKGTSDMSGPLTKIHDQLQKGGLSFLEKYTRLEEMEQLYNRHPKHNLPLVHNQINRCLRGMVLAHLNQRPDFDDLAIIYRERLQELRAPEVTIQKFERLRDYLRSYSQN